MWVGSLSSSPPRGSTDGAYVRAIFYAHPHTTAAAAAAASKKRKRPNTRTLKAALSGECDVGALLRALHEDVAAVRRQQEPPEPEPPQQEEQPQGQEPEAAAVAAGAVPGKGDASGPGAPAAASGGGSPARKRPVNAAGTYVCACVLLCG